MKSWLIFNNSSKRKIRALNVSRCHPSERNRQVIPAQTSSVVYRHSRPPQTDMLAGKPGGLPQRGSSSLLFTHLPSLRGPSFSLPCQQGTLGIGVSVLFFLCTCVWFSLANKQILKYLPGFLLIHSCCSKTECSVPIAPSNHSKAFLFQNSRPFLTTTRDFSRFSHTPEYFYIIHMTCHMNI